jgi:hypothetical protein
VENWVEYVYNNNKKKTTQKDFVEGNKPLKLAIQKLLVPVMFL